MKNWSDSDPSLKVGDLVFSNYHKNQLLYRIIKIHERFLDEYDVGHHQNVFPGCQIGDQYNCMVHLEAVLDLNIKADSKKKLHKKITSLDSAWVVKVLPEHIEAHIKKLEELKILLT